MSEENQKPEDTVSEQDIELVKNELKEIVLGNIGSSEKGERFYGRKFKTAYNVLRKSAVNLNKARKKIGNEKAYELLNDVCLSLFGYSELNAKDNSESDEADLSEDE